MRNVLLIAFHYPPLRGSSGIQRALRFSQYLPDFGWRPFVLTVTVGAYEDIDPRSLGDIPQGVQVHRAPAFDASRHFAFAGRYPGILARPDRWMSWTYTGTAAGIGLCRRHDVDAIWSTYPIASAHVIGARIARRTGLPWIADFRDPMAQDGYPSDPATWRAFRAVETETARRAAAMTFTTRGARTHYASLFPDVPADRFRVLENGYDEDSFAAAPVRISGSDAGRKLFLHSGIVYPSERDPTHLFRALGALKRSGDLTADRAVFRFRASRCDDLLQRLARDNGVEDVVELVGAIPYRDALEEMLSADALLLLQASNCNSQIPAKLYEYMRARRPIIALTDGAGDTAERLVRWGYDTIAPLDQTEAIAALLSAALDGNVPLPILDRETIDASSRRGLTQKLAQMLDGVAANGPRQSG